MQAFWKRKKRKLYYIGEAGKHCSMRWTKLCSIAAKHRCIPIICLCFWGKAAGEAGLQNVIDFFVRYYESRASSYLFFCRTEAEDLFALQDADGKYPLAEETDILTDAEQVAGRSVNATVVDVVNGLNAPGQSAYLSVMEADESKNPAERNGVFSGWRLCRHVKRGRVAGGNAIAEKPVCLWCGGCPCGGYRPSYAVTAGCILSA